MTVFFLALIRKRIYLKYLLILFSMKHIYLLLPVLFLTCVHVTQAAPEPKFVVQKFASCSELEQSLVKVMERYQDRYWYPMYTRGGMVLDMAVMEKSAVAPTANVAQGTTASDA